MKIIRERNRAGLLVYRQDFQPDLCPHEAVEQINAIAWLREKHPQYAVMAFHVPNEGNIPAQYRQDLLRQGLLPGVSDIIIIKSSQMFPAGVFEMKRASVAKSKVSPEQRQFIQLAEMDGKMACLTYGAEAFKAAFLDYIGAC